MKLPHLFLLIACALTFICSAYAENAVKPEDENPYFKVWQADNGYILIEFIENACANAGKGNDQCWKRRIDGSGTNRYPDSKHFRQSVQDKINAGYNQLQPIEDTAQDPGTAKVLAWFKQTLADFNSAEEDRRAQEPEADAEKRETATSNSTDQSFKVVPGEQDSGGPEGSGQQNYSNSTAETIPASTDADARPTAANATTSDTAAEETNQAPRANGSAPTGGPSAFANATVAADPPANSLQWFQMLWSQLAYIFTAVILFLIIFVLMWRILTKIKQGMAKISLLSDELHESRQNLETSLSSSLSTAMRSVQDDFRSLEGTVKTTLNSQLENIFRAIAGNERQIRQFIDGRGKDIANVLLAHTSPALSRLMDQRFTAFQTAVIQRLKADLSQYAAASAARAVDAQNNLYQSIAKQIMHTASTTQNGIKAHFNSQFVEHMKETGTIGENISTAIEKMAVKQTSAIGAMLADQSEHVVQLLSSNAEIVSLLEKYSDETGLQMERSKEFLQTQFANQQIGINSALDRLTTEYSKEAHTIQTAIDSQQDKFANLLAARTEAALGVLTDGLSSQKMAFNEALAKLTSDSATASRHIQECVEGQFAHFASTVSAKILDDARTMQKHEEILASMHIMRLHQQLYPEDSSALHLGEMEREPQVHLLYFNALKDSLKQKLDKAWQQLAMLATGEGQEAEENAYCKQVLELARFQSVYSEIFQANKLERLSTAAINDSVMDFLKNWRGNAGISSGGIPIAAIMGLNFLLEAMLMRIVVAQGPEHPVFVLHAVLSNIEGVIREIGKSVGLTFHKIPVGASLQSSHLCKKEDRVSHIMQSIAGSPTLAPIFIRWARQFCASAKVADNDLILNVAAIGYDLEHENKHNSETTLVSAFSHIQHLLT